MVLAILSALPTIGPYMPGGLSAAALGLAVGTDPGPVLGPVLVNLALLVVLAVASWAVFRHQEL